MVWAMRLLFEYLDPLGNRESNPEPRSKVQELWLETAKPSQSALLLGCCCAMGPCSYMVYTWVLKYFRCSVFWAYVCTI